MVVFMRPLVPKVITMVATLVLAFSVVLIVIAAMVVVIDPPTVVTVVVMLWRVIGLLRSSQSSLMSFSVSSASA